MRWWDIACRPMSPERGPSDFHYVDDPATAFFSKLTRFLKEAGALNRLKSQASSFSTRTARGCGDVPLFVEHCEAAVAEIDVRRRWLDEQGRRELSFSFVVLGTTRSKIWRRISLSRKAVQPIHRERRMVRNLIVAIELAEPAVSKVQRHSPLCGCRSSPPRCVSSGRKPADVTPPAKVLVARLVKAFQLRDSLA